MASVAAAPILIDVTSLLQGLVNDGENFAGISLAQGSLGQSNFFAPTLIVITTPEPTTAALLGLGMLFLASSSGRRRNMLR